MRRLLFSPGKVLGWRLASFSGLVRARMHLAICHLFPAAGLKIPQTMRTMYIVRMLQAAETRYAPKKYAGRIVLFRGGGLEEHTDGSNMGWDGLADVLENHEIGDGGLRSRRDIMNEPLVGLLATELRACLEKARDSEPVEWHTTRTERSAAASSSMAPAIPAIEPAG